MAHVEQQQFCNSVLEMHRDYFKNAIVLDIGSLDVNGNNKYLFSDCLYLGLDVAVGANVDFVSKGHELALPSESVDVIISTECFEHDRYYVQTLQNIVRMLKPGGLFLFTCATTGRAEHGTRRTTLQDAPLLEQYGDWSDYYKNITQEDIESAIPVKELFSSYAFSVNGHSHDLYFWGIKAGVRVVRANYSFLDATSGKGELQMSRDEVVKVKNEMAKVKDVIASRDARIKELEAQLKAQAREIKRLNEKCGIYVKDFKRLRKKALFRLYFWYKDRKKQKNVRH